MIAFDFKLSLYNHQLKSVYKSSYFKKAVTLEVRIRVNCRSEKSVQKKMKETHLQMWRFIRVKMLTSFYSLAEHQPWMVNTRLLAEFELEFEFFLYFMWDR